MNRLKLCLFATLLSSLTAAHAQRPVPPPDDGGLRTLPGSTDEDQPEGPRRVTRVENMLLRGDYARLDEMAAPARTEKTRSLGGGWLLHTFYDELNPRETDEQVLAVRREKLEAWIKQNPQSITARVALAEFYTRWAWVARTAATADKVPESAWPIFKERAKKSGEILHDAIKLDQKCPEWYAALQTVALAEDWDNNRTKSLFEQASKFEPDYQYYYQRYADYLLPKWDGSEQASLDFIKQSADKRGGEPGDILYFQIATVLIARGNAGFKPQLDWDRLQRGYKALETTFGTTNSERNHFAYMAVRFKDRDTAQKQFAIIGDKWARGVWKKRAAYDFARNWAARTQTPATPGEPQPGTPTPQAARSPGL